MRYITITLATFLIINCGGTPNKPISKEKLVEINDCLDEVGGEIQHNWEATYKTEDNTLVMQIIIDAEDTNIEMKNYCDDLKKVANKYAPRYNFSGEISQLGKIVKHCN